jgi:hypothetical protein
VIVACAPLFSDPVVLVAGFYLLPVGGDTWS